MVDFLFHLEDPYMLLLVLLLLLECFLVKSSGEKKTILKILFLNLTTHCDTSLFSLVVVYDFVCINFSLRSFVTPGFYLHSNVSSNGKKVCCVTLSLKGSKIVTIRAHSIIALLHSIL